MSDFPNVKGKKKKFTQSRKNWMKLIPHHNIFVSYNNFTAKQVQTEVTFLTPV